MNWKNVIQRSRAKVMYTLSQKDKEIVQIHNQATAAFVNKYTTLLSPFLLQNSQKYNLEKIKRDFRINPAFRRQFREFSLDIMQQQEYLAEQTQRQTKNLMAIVYEQAVFDIRGNALSPLEKVIFNQKVEKPWLRDGLTYKDRINKNTQKIKAQMQSVLWEGLSQGENPEITKKKISRRFEVQKHQAETLLRTEGVAYFNDGLYKAFYDIGATGYQVLGVGECLEWCPVGEKYKMSQWDEGTTAPPFHPNCQCYIIPLFD